MNAAQSQVDRLNPPSKPTFIYGTAWKEDRTELLTKLALQQGFRAIDTANQRKHYFEVAVGQAIQSAIDEQVIERHQLFLQSKYTFQGGQDDRLPYDPLAPIETQVHQSFESSLDHLRTDYLDSYVLHGPSQRRGLGANDWSAWKAMEEIHSSDRARALGISNVGLDQLQVLCDRATVRPEFVQNRCYAILEWDRPVREFCQANQIAYQGFSLLTANAEYLRQPAILQIARQCGVGVAQVVFRFATDVGMIPLTGTSNPTHMQQDLAITDFQLSESDVQFIEKLAVS